MLLISLFNLTGLGVEPTLKIARIKRIPYLKRSLITSLSVVTVDRSDCTTHRSAHTTELFCVMPRTRSLLWQDFYFIRKAHQMFAKTSWQPQCPSEHPSVHARWIIGSTKLDFVMVLGSVSHCDLFNTERCKISIQPINQCLSPHISNPSVCSTYIYSANLMP